MPAALEAALARHRWISIASLLLLTVLAWLWLLGGAGMGMDPLVSLAPVSTSPGAGGGMAMDMPMDTQMPSTVQWSLGWIVLVVSMWWIMMVAMMLPSAAPTILLYARAAASGGATTPPAAAAFLAGYLIAWGLFSHGAALLQFALERVGFLAPMSMASQSRWLSAAVLIAAGLYQLSPFKDVCLRQCRNPAQFISRYYRPGASGALRMGLLHGAYCVGCCWILMALLFVGGVMNLAWIALLTLLVAAEKLLPFGRAVAIGGGLAMLAWGGAILLGLPG